MKKNMLNCSSLIRVAVIMVVMAFMASLVTDTFARGCGNYGLKRIINNIHACNHLPNCEQCNPDGNTDNCSQGDTFNTVQSAHYWSSTTFVDDTSVAWYGEHRQWPRGHQPKVQLQPCMVCTRRTMIC